jgi:hypothetical protein
LMLDESTRFMTLSVLKKIKTLVDAGVKIIGKQPEKSPSLADNDAEFQAIAKQIWSSQQVISAAGISTQPDIQISKTVNKILFKHRKIAESDTDIYWLNNRSETATEAEVSFRVAGKKPEIWNAVTGKIQEVGYKIQNGRTTVSIPFEAWDALFVVFSKPTKVLSLNKPKATEQVLASISTPWSVNIAGKNITTTVLTSWHTNADADIKYFSGTAVYKNSFKLTQLSKSTSILIDLGDVKNLATLTINGQKVGTAWKAPYKIDVTQFVKVGENAIQIEVTNTWANRIIGDAQPDVKTKVAFVTMPFYKADGTLLPAGLLSEVKVLKVSGL